MKSFLNVPMINGTLNLGSISFTKRMGWQKVIDSGVLFNANGPSRVTAEHNVPMVAQIKWLPTIGDSQNNDYALNTAANKYYTYIRSKNASLAAYLPIDIQKMLIAIANLNVEVAEIERQITVMKSPNSFSNAAMTAGINKVLMNTTANDDKVIYQYIAQLNIIKEKLQGIVIPKDVKLFNRWFNLASKIFRDDPKLAKTQYFAYCILGYYYLDLNPSSPTVGQFLFQRVDNDNIAGRLSKLEVLVTRYVADEDFNNIAAEIKKAYLPNERLTFKAKEYNDYGIIEPVFDMVTLDTIRNATYIGEVDPSHLQIREITGANVSSHLAHYDSTWSREGIFCNGVESAVTGEYQAMDHGLPEQLQASDGNMVLPVHVHEDEPDEQTVLDATSGFCHLRGLNGSIYCCALCYGTELYLTYSVYWNNNPVARTWSWITMQTFVPSSFVTGQNLTYINTFSVVPNSYLINGTTDVLWIHGDIDNYALINPKELKDAKASAVTALIQPMNSDNVK